jgi:hypothetical protein
MPKLRHRFVVGLAVAAVLLGAAPAIGSPGREPALVASYKWGWVTVRNTSLGSYTPAAVDRGNSSDRSVIVKQPAAGSYTVRFKGIGDDGGIPHVTVLGSAQRICLIRGWGRGSTSTNLEVYVSCYTLAGLRVSTRFSLTYISTYSDTGSLAYLWASGTESGDANSQYSFNSAGGINHIERTGVGAYQVALPGLGTGGGGHVEISAWNGGLSTAGVEPAGVNPTTCNVESWGPGSGTQFINVLCYESNGLAVDTGFTLSYTDHQGLKGRATGKVAYVWADQPASQAYTPHPIYSYSRPAATPHVTSGLLGRFKVKLPSMPLGGGAVVTAYGSTGHTCQLENIRTSGSFQRVKVRCFDFSGSFADSQFNLSYLR